MNVVSADPDPAERASESLHAKVAFTAAIQAKGGFVYHLPFQAH